MEYVSGLFDWIIMSLGCMMFGYLVYHGVTLLVKAARVGGEEEHVEIKNAKGFDTVIVICCLILGALFTYSDSRVIETEKERFQAEYIQELEDRVEDLRYQLERYQ